MPVVAKCDGNWDISNIGFIAADDNNDNENKEQSMSYPWYNCISSHSFKCECGGISITNTANTNTNTANTARGAILSKTGISIITLLCIIECDVCKNIVWGNINLKIKCVWEHYSVALIWLSLSLSFGRQCQVMSVTAKTWWSVGRVWVWRDGSITTLLWSPVRICHYL